jgi:hypothetical protein
MYPPGFSPPVSKRNETVATPPVSELPVPMLPPGAISGESGPPPQPKQTAHELLPPGSPSSTGNTPGQQVALPTQTPKSEPAQPRDSIRIRGEDGSYVTLTEPKKVVGEGDKQRALRTLTPEEKARARFVKNILVWSFCAILLAIALVLLTRLSG